MVAPASTAAGFSLIEVLVALVVLSVGLLGLAALQQNAVRFNHDAYLRSQATVLAYDIADRIRGNRQAATDGPYYSEFAATPPACNASSPLGRSWRRTSARGGVRSPARSPPATAKLNGTMASEILTITVQWDPSRGAVPWRLDAEQFVMTTGL